MARLGNISFFPLVFDIGNTSTWVIYLFRLGLRSVGLRVVVGEVTR